MPCLPLQKKVSERLLSNYLSFLVSWRKWILSHSAFHFYAIFSVLRASGIK
uniref:Uncharacterized protein n=1 Tax=Rhizophora mucronata TaxID=61149 RepID=A0A2P2JSI0_RHIMU